MASPQQMSGFGALGGMHTAGIYSDMTVDGPEIGTLVVVVDRAKNLPNRKTMGKQNPYCAARLGKEAKKTETDKRGGQTPKWDQELRFVVHESPDYNNLKVSVFNDDKKTDMIGEMWVNLEEVIIPGGGKNDGWHTLNYKGKYAGEVMLELTYYDSRPDQRADALKESLRHDKKIKRRPLPAELHTTPLPHQMENTRTAGPRAMGSRPRAPSSNASGSVIQGGAPPVQYPNHYAQQEDLDYHPGFQPQQPSMPDLPELPPSRSHRGSLPPHPRSLVPHAASYHGQVPGHQHPPEMHHSHSEPIAVPQAHDPYAHSQPRPRSKRYDEPPGWEGGNMQGDGHHRGQLQPTVEDEYEDLPPLPPSHRNTTPRQAQYVPNMSPLQALERRSADMQSSRGPPARSHSMDDYAPAPLVPSNHNTPPNFRNSYSGQRSQTGYAPSSAGSSPGLPRPVSSHRLSAARQSISDPYNTPPRAHPLAHELQRSSSPAPHYAGGYEDQYHGYPADSAPIIKPRAISPAPTSPAPAPRNSIASIRHPVQSFGLSTSPSAMSTQSSIPDLSRLPTRKSVSPRPSTSGSGTVPFGPDDFNTFNPNATSTSPFTHAQSTNPHSPYHIPNTPGSNNRAGSEEPPANRPLPNPDGPITTWDGRTVDPSDHLPVQSWAPEPVKKGGDKEKIYGQGGYDANRARGLSGPRTNIHNVPASGGRVGRDFVVNVKNRHSPNPASGGFDGSPGGRSPAGRSRLTKRASGAAVAGSHSVYDGGVGPGPLNEIEVPNPYAHPGSNGAYRAHSPAPPGYQERGSPSRHYGDLFGGNYENGSPRQSQPQDGQYAQQQQQHQYQQQYPQQKRWSPSQYAGGDGYGGDYAGYNDQNGYDDQGGRGYYADGRGGSGAGGGRAYSEPPELPPKIPFDDHAYGVSALEKELQRIDIGGSRRPGSNSGRRGGGGSGSASASGTVVTRRRYAG